MTWALPGIGALEKMAHGLISAKIGIWVGKALSAIGLGFVAQKLVWDPLIAQAQDAWNAIPADIAAWIHAFGFDTGISILLSAYGIRGASRIFVRRMENHA